jgi:hypothetical protein
MVSTRKQNKMAQIILPFLLFSSLVIAQTEASITYFKDKYGSVKTTNELKQLQNHSRDLRTYGLDLRTSSDRDRKFILSWRSGTVQESILKSTISMCTGPTEIKSIKPPIKDYSRK